MSIISEELYLFAEELQTVLQELAKQVGFVQRLSKYQASTSLTQLCSLLHASTGVLMSPEGLNQRFNQTAVAFLQAVFTSLLTQKLCSS